MVNNRYIINLDRNHGIINIIFLTGDGFACRGLAWQQKASHDLYQQDFLKMGLDHHWRRYDWIFT
jgi:hypothetical protein